MEVSAFKLHVASLRDWMSGWCVCVFLIDKVYLSCIYLLPCLTECLQGISILFIKSITGIINIRTMVKVITKSSTAISGPWPRHPQRVKQAQTVTASAVTLETAS